MVSGCYVYSRPLIGHWPNWPNWHLTQWPSDTLTHMTHCARPMKTWPMCNDDSAALHGFMNQSNKQWLLSTYVSIVKVQRDDTLHDAANSELFHMHFTRLWGLHHTQSNYFAAVSLKLLEREARVNVHWAMSYLTHHSKWPIQPTDWWIPAECAVMVAETGQSPPSSHRDLGISSHLRTVGNTREQCPTIGCCNSQ